MMCITLPFRVWMSEEAGLGSAYDMKPTKSCPRVGLARYVNSHGKCVESGVPVHVGSEAAVGVVRWKYDCMCMALSSASVRRGGSIGAWAAISWRVLRCWVA